jgi:hypothetical protein
MFIRKVEFDLIASKKKKKKERLQKQGVGDICQNKKKCK